jgi:hypothetical protein
MLSGQTTSSPFLRIFLCLHEFVLCKLQLEICLDICCYRVKGLNGRIICHLASLLGWQNWPCLLILLFSSCSHHIASSFYVTEQAGQGFADSARYAQPKGLSPRALLVGLPWPAPSVVHKQDPWVLLQRRRHNFWNRIQIQNFKISHHIHACRPQEICSCFTLHIILVHTHTACQFVLANFKHARKCW